MAIFQLPPGREVPDMADLLVDVGSHWVLVERLDIFSTNAQCCWKHGRQSNRHSYQKLALTTHSLQGVFAQAGTGHEDPANVYLHQKVPTLNVRPLWIECSNQPSPGVITIAWTETTPTKHLVQHLTFVDCNNSLCPRRSELTVHKNISNLRHQCSSEPFFLKFLIQLGVSTVFRVLIQINQQRFQNSPEQGEPTPSWIKYKTKTILGNTTQNCSNRLDRVPAKSKWVGEPD